MLELNHMLWWIPALPLLGFVINGLWGKRFSEMGVAVVGCLGPMAAFVISVFALLEVTNGGQPAHTWFSWMATGSLSVHFGLSVDALTAVMLMVVTGVGSAIHVYSYGYMHGDEGFSRFFAYLNLFMFAMLLLVMADNLLLLFVGWEGVGLCSYLLIGFWYQDLENADAGRKAFIANRIGDFAFLLGMFSLFALAGSLDFRLLAEHLHHVDLTAIVVGGPFAGWSVKAVLQFSGVCLFVGATGKSAQIPLYTWLPDAMAGPTPVSALIHAATMVTAGVYMIGRLNFMYALLPSVMAGIALVAAATATLAGIIAIAQNDIKKVLAYSTISQLGYMFCGMAATVFAAGVFHLVTHAFFKALLFLGAGAVIHGMHGEQDIRKMGGLRRDMRGVYILFGIGALALAGLPPLAGFWSKDAILGGVHLQMAHNGGLWNITWWLLVVTAGVTAFYTLRLVILTFFGAPADPQRHVHKIHPTMMGALGLLAILSAVGGVLTGILPEFTQDVWSHVGGVHELGHEAMEHSHHVAMTYSVIVVLLGMSAAIFLYGFKRDWVTQFVAGSGRKLHRIVENKFYVDELYDLLFVNPVGRAAPLLWAWVDRWFIDQGLVEGTAKQTQGAGSVLSRTHTGAVNLATASMVIGAIVILAYIWMSGVGHG
jgi:NADH-quinone oxidoreductase subunit L